MPTREEIPANAGHPYACNAAERWTVDPHTMIPLIRAATLFRSTRGKPVWIISGYRSPARQEELRRQGRPTAPPGKSTHTTCPATGVDLSLGLAPSRGDKMVLGTLAELHGLRWGGGSPRDEDGIPSDWNHFDVGPRQG